MSDIKSTPTAPSTFEDWRADARYFREMTEGWAFAAAVACSEAPGNGNGNRRERDTSGKVSARAFAREAGTTADRVMRYLRVWAKAAEMGFVEPADTLTPGSAETVELPPEEVEWRGMVIVANADAAADVKPIPAKPKQSQMSAPISIIEERGHRMDEAKKDVQHIADAALNLPEFSDEDRAQVLKFVNEMAALLLKIKKSVLDAKTSGPKKTAA
ncbi:hypothetical protein [Amnibacterium kyonggiense]|uniref:Uncharacterized protein n=1 Tax=Amnibacterium kyonggiense TaxID=595671 RepID=A0A4R7FGJ9_9MICO|nr:hypothetical protein [Amnibacterium kyonggiense]TDS74502.1 hypothetical protein CLV52_3685 [Amnibacterium kyonggiense]